MGDALVAAEACPLRALVAYQEESHGALPVVVTLPIATALVVRVLPAGARGRRRRRAGRRRRPGALAVPAERRRPPHADPEGWVRLGGAAADGGRGGAQRVSRHRLRRRRYRC